MPDCSETQSFSPEPLDLTQPPAVLGLWGWTVPRRLETLPSFLTQKQKHSFSQGPGLLLSESSPGATCLTLTPFSISSSSSQSFGLSGPLSFSIWVNHRHLLLKIELTISAPKPASPVSLLHGEVGGEGTRGTQSAFSPSPFILHQLPKPYTVTSPISGLHFPPLSLPPPLRVSCGSVLVVVPATSPTGHLTFQRRPRALRIKGCPWWPRQSSGYISGLQPPWSFRFSKMPEDAEIISGRLSPLLECNLSLPLCHVPRWCCCCCGWSGVCSWRTAVLQGSMLSRQLVRFG